MSIKKFIFVYLTTNNINGKQYVGEHSTDNINDNYIGSGLGLKLAIKKYGRNNFSKVILEFFNNKEEAFNNQQYYIKKYDTLSPNGYNISLKGGHQCSNSFSDKTKELLKEKRKLQKPPYLGKKHTLETKEKMRKSHLGKTMSDESKRKNREKHLKKVLSEETIIKMRKPKTEEHKQNMRKPKIKRKNNLVKKDNLIKKQGYWKGKKLPQETIEKMKISGKGKNKGPISEKRRLSIINGIKNKKEILAQASSGL